MFPVIGQTKFVLQERKAKGKTKEKTNAETKESKNKKYKQNQNKTKWTQAKKNNTRTGQTKFVLQKRKPKGKTKENHKGK